MKYRLMQAFDPIFILSLGVSLRLHQFNVQKCFIHLKMIDTPVSWTATVLKSG
jgi:hypothetical protein